MPLGLDTVKCHVSSKLVLPDVSCLRASHKQNFLEVTFPIGYYSRIPSGLLGMPTNQLSESFQCAGHTGKTSLALSGDDERHLHSICTHHRSLLWCQHRWVCGLWEHHQPRHSAVDIKPTVAHQVGESDGCGACRGQLPGKPYLHKLYQYYHQRHCT